jgi:uncharacterized protein YyaL (SSP411 family)
MTHATTHDAQATNSNRLAKAASPYLQSAAHQPIDWHEFGPEAFAQAVAQDKPILLDIGAVWCHWCHVIDRESYEDAEIASLISDHFIAIKVDRDERPDVDARYQKAVQSLSGQGGWPLTAFLTHDGRVLYGGTYFPPEAMKKLLVQIHQIYHERKQDLFAEGEALTPARVAKAEAVDGAEKPVSSDADALGRAIDHFLQIIEGDANRQYDPRYGGFGAQPKFPHLSALQVLLAMDAGHPDIKRVQIVTHALEAMAHGGIHDHVAGGFHRYSVDAEWHVPHFEKMAYDNAEALKVYVQAYRATGETLFLSVARSLLDWLQRDLNDSIKGGFYASQDADINLEDDGDHFTWTVDEVHQALDEDEARLVVHYYDLTPEGDMHHGPHQRPGRNVLRVRQPLKTVANHLGLSDDKAHQVLQSAKAKMLAARQRRPVPFIDTSRYTHWNGMLIEACFEAADLLGHASAEHMAVQALDRLLSVAYDPQTGFAHRVDAQGVVVGTLEDQAWGALALLRGYQSTGKKAYLSAAQQVADIILTDYADAESGGFNDLPASRRQAGLGLLKLSFKPQDDTPSSSATGIVLQVLQQLMWLANEQTDRARYEQALAFHLAQLIPQVQGHGLYAGAIGVAAFRWRQPVLKIQVGSQPELQTAARHVAYPNKLIQHGSPDAPTVICMGQQCLSAVTDAETLEAQVAQAIRTHLKPLAQKL